MALQRTLNLRFLCVLVGVLVVLALGVAVLHGYQVQRNAKVIKDRARQELESGRFDRAATNYRLYLLHVPEDAEAKRAWAQCLERKARRSTRDMQQEVFLLEQVLQSDPEDHAARRRLVQVLIGMQRTNDAMDHIAELLKAFPTDTELERWYAGCLLRKGEETKAEQYLRKSMGHDKHDLASYRDLAALLLTRRNNSAEAGKVMESLVRENPDKYEAHLLRADFLRTIGKPKEAAGEVAAAVKLQPNDVRVVLAATQIALAEGKLDDAREHLQGGLKEHSDSVELYRLLARVDLQTKRQDEAIDTLRRGVDLVAEDNRNLLRRDLAEILVEKGDAGAADIIKQLRDQHGPQALLDELEARRCMQTGQWREAAHLLEACRRGSGRTPGEIYQTNLLLGRCYDNLGEPDRALMVYRDALAGNYQGTAARAGIAASFRALGKDDEALLEYRNLLPADPSAALPIAELLVLRNKRPEYKDRANWQEVNDMLDRAAKQTPESPAIATLRAEALVAQGQIPQAVTVVKEACDRHPDQLELWLELARVTQLCDGPEKGLAVLEQAKQKLGDRVELRLAAARYWVTHRNQKDATAALAKLETDTQKLGKDEPHFLQGLADIYFQGGRNEDAKRACLALLDKDKNSLHARLLLFDLALQKGDDEATSQALADLKQTEGNEGSLWRYAEAWLDLVAASKNKTDPQARRAKLKQARDLLEQVTAQRPSWGAVRLRLAEISLLEGDREAAIRAATQAADLGETDPEILRQIVDSLFRSQRYREALQLLAKLPGDALTGSLGKLSDRLYLQIKDPATAIARARRPIQQGSKDPRDYLWLGQILSAAGSQEYQAEAGKTLRQALTLPAADKVPELWVFLVQFLTLTGHKDQAEAVTKQAKQKLAPDLVDLVLAQCSETLNEPAQALEYYQAALKARPEDPARLMNVAGFHLRRGQFPEAEPYLQQLLRPESKASDADRNWARRGLAARLGSSGDYEQFLQALRYLDENAKAIPGSTEDMRARAMVLLMHPSTKPQAARLFEELSRQESPSIGEQLVRARLYEQIGEKTNAYREYSLVASASQNPDQMMECVRGLLNIGELAAAQHWLARLNTFDSRVRQNVQPQIMELEALLDSKEGKTAAAVAVVKQLQQAAGADPSQVASLYERIGQPALAEEMLRTLAKAQDPRNTLKLAAFLGRQGRFPEALDLCEQVSNTLPPETVAGVAAGLLDQSKELSPPQLQQLDRILSDGLKKNLNSTFLMICLAALRDKQRNYTEVATLYADILRRDPRNWVVLNNLAWLLAEWSGQVGDALTDIQQAIHLAGPRPELLDTRALVYLRLDNVAGAIQDLEAALKLAPRAATYFHLAQAQHQAERDTEALASFHSARDLKVARELHPLEQPQFKQLAEALGQK